VIAPGRVSGITMLPEIRIKAQRREDKLDRMARIDFCRLYTIEHNVKVYEFGLVAKDHMERLVQNWIRTMLGGDSSGMGLELGSKLAKDESSDERDVKEEEGEGEEEEQETAEDNPYGRTQVPN
jgi:hypothetical protein